MTTPYSNADLGNIIAHLNESTFSTCPLGALVREGQALAVTAQFKNFYLRTELLPVVICTSGQTLGYAAKLRVFRGHTQVTPQELFVAVNHRDEWILLERLCRALHALNRVACNATGLLFLQVRTPYLDAASSGRGQVFESILAACGIATSQVVIQVRADDLQSDGFVDAIRSYRSWGYRIGVLASTTAEAATWGRSAIVDALGVRLPVSNTAA